MEYPDKIWWIKFKEAPDRYLKMKPETIMDKIIHEKMRNISEALEDLISIL